MTKHNSRAAPLHPGGVPALPVEVTREAYSHEVFSAGFWPGGGGTDFPAFYSYAYPAPNGFSVMRSRSPKKRTSIRTSANSCCRTRRAEIQRPRSDAHGISGEHL